MSGRPDTIDRAVRDHYGERSLDAAQLGRLEGAIRANTGGRSLRWAWRAAAAAAAVLLAVGITWLAARRPDGERLSREVIAGVATLHREPFRPAFQSEDFAGLRSQMTGLGFAAIEPKRCAESDYRVAGARYATIHGERVAEIRLAYVDGPPVTLCEMRPDSFREVRDGSVTVDGTPVTLWHEGGLLLALAGTPSE
jgi:hypothetical protein